MKLLVLPLSLLLAGSAFAATEKTVSYPSGNDTVQGFLYTPTGKGPFPALVVIHEWWGLVPWVKDQANKLADQGYVTLAVDLYRGKSTTDPAEARQLSGSLPRERADGDLLAAVQFLKSQKNVDPKRVGAIGWCMGGGYAFDLAAQEPTLKAAVINYGRVSSDPGVLKKINAAVLGIFGGQDRAYPADTARKLDEQMKALGKKIEVTVYPDAGHAFENPENKTGYRPADAADAWKKTVDFLQANLKK
jgi:carboxymethylenebutenolidase